MTAKSLGAASSNPHLGTVTTASPSPPEREPHEVRDGEAAPSDQLQRLDYWAALAAMLPEDE